MLDTYCHPVELEALDDARSLNEAKEICWNDNLCSEFYVGVWGDYVKCAADSKRDSSANTILYIKGIKYFFYFDVVIHLFILVVKQLFIYSFFI